MLTLPWSAALIDGQSLRCMRVKVAEQEQGMNGCGEDVLLVVGTDNGAQTGWQSGGGGSDAASRGHLACIFKRLGDYRLTFA
jgi:hypothetical protein